METSPGANLEKDKDNMEKIHELLKRLSESTALAPEDRQILADFDLDAAINKASSTARKKAESEAARLKAALETAKLEADEARRGSEAGEASLKAQIDKLTRSFNALKAEADEAKARAEALRRESAIVSFAEKHGVKAPQGVSGDAVLKLYKLALADVDVDDADAMGEATKAFKEANPALIAAAGKAAPAAGSPVRSGAPSANPFARDSWNVTRQVQMMASSPAQAQALAAEAGIKL